MEGRFFWIMASASTTYSLSELLAMIRPVPIRMPAHRRFFALPRAKASATTVALLSAMPILRNPFSREGRARNTAFRSFTKPPIR